MYVPKNKDNTSMLHLLLNSSGSIDILFYNRCNVKIKYGFCSLNSFGVVYILRKHFELAGKE